MRSILRFLVFLAFVAACVSALYFWRAYSLAAAPAASSTAAASSHAPFARHAQTAKAIPPSSAQPSASGDSPAASQLATSPSAASEPDSQIGVGLRTLLQIDREFQELVARTRLSVVSITAQSEMNFLQGRALIWGTMKLPQNLGSGAIISKEGHIVTNLHVIKNADSIIVTLHDGRSLPAKVVGADPLTDIAILKIEADNLVPLNFGNSDLVRPGQTVFAVGNPYGLQETVTMGIISGIGRRTTSEMVNEFFQTDAAINPGNSGGPLLNLNGEIIGINNAIHTQDGGWQGIGFSIPSNTARRVYEDLRRFGRVVRAWFGVAWSIPMTPEVARRIGLSDPSGVLIQYTFEDSPADRAGLLPGDVILEFNGRKIHDGIDLRNRVAEAAPGDEIHVKVFRKGRTLELKVVLREFPHNF
jgi:serine protease Do